MKAPLRILLVDDDLGDARMIARAIRQSGLDAECTGAVDVAGGLAECVSRAFDCAIVDYQLPGQDGLEALLSFGTSCPFMPLVMSTGHGDEAIATEAMKRGASDYIRKNDITPSAIRRAIENAVEKVDLRRRLSDQQKELERFADVLVHDLRAPSSSIQTFLTYIKEDLLAGNMEMISQYCDFAIKAANRMDTLIATLYQYTRLVSDVSFEPVSMNTVLEGAIANLHTVIRARGAVITHSELPVVTGSAPLLEQLLQNLIGNGIKYCKREVPQIHVHATPRDDGRWTFSVKDNGIGVPQEDRQRIFESFTRLHGVGEYEGTGLGLATCAKIVARHGGTIYCDSVEGEGTTFFFTLRSAASVSESTSGESNGEQGDLSGSARAA
jgi:signal transduction histidine kinase